MREQFESTPQSSNSYITESNEARKERMDKKRAIRKNKVHSNFCQHGKQQKQKVTKQQKIQMQKAKNRQAAQRSRDQHKKYVQNLEEQIRELKQQLSKPKYCLRCSKELALETSDSSDNSPLDMQMENPIPVDIKIQNNQEFQEYYNNDSSYIRIHEYEQSSPLKMFMFISMIILGLFLAGDSFMTQQTTTLFQSGGNTRQLMEVNNQEPQKQFSNKQFQKAQKQRTSSSLIDNQRQLNQNFSQNQIYHDMKKADLMNHISNSFNSNNGQMTSIVPLTYEYSPLNEENCLKSLIQQKYIIQTQPRFYDFSQEKNLRYISKNSQNHQLDIFQSLSSYEKDQKNILFCTLPKIYRRNQQKDAETKNFGLFSKIIDIIVSGSQMMQIIGKLDPTDLAGSNLWMNRVVNFEGLYKINAQIKGIVQISDQNCVL